MSEKDFLGKYMLVFFGYHLLPRHLPYGTAGDDGGTGPLGPEAEKIQPVFVSIDPERDTPEVLKSYVENFGPRLIGLTGTPRRSPLSPRPIASTMRRRQTSPRPTPI